MSGLLDTGTSYQNRALSGFVRASALSQAQKQAAATIKNQGDVQEVQQRNQAMAAGGAVGYAAGPAVAGWLAGAEAGAVATPYAPYIGAIVGAGLGYLFSELF